MLTEAQRTILATELRASTYQPIVDALAIGDNVALTAIVNEDSNFVVWKTALTREALHGAYVWTELDSLTLVKFEQFKLLISVDAIDASDPNVRQGFADIFNNPQLSGTLANLLALAKRFATRVEAIYATGTGTNGDPGSLVVEGTLSRQELGQALVENPE